MPFVTWNPLSLSPRLSLSRARYEFVNPRNYPYFVLVFLLRFTEVENADSMSIWLRTQRIIEMSAFVDFVCNLPVDILSRVHRLGATNSLRLSRLSGPYSTVWGFVQRCKKVPTETMESGTKIDLVSGDESVAAGLLEIAARILNRHSKVSSD